MSEQKNKEFFELIKAAREEIKSDLELQASSWAWVHELDDEGFFIFCYLRQDFNQNIISKKDLEDTVYTLVMLRHKFLPGNLPPLRDLPILSQMQPIFNLYEKLKKEEMDWEACQDFINEQLETLPIFQNN
ncbi:MAG: hypothetical protein HQM13_08580 [SAR324 cluster bacterium]|nr:hypothetical protein [SAR324 cluster bacterium]